MSDARNTSQTGGVNSANTNNRTRSRSPISRPTTPLRTSSRSSFRNSHHGISNAGHGVIAGKDGGGGGGGSTGLAALDALEPQFAELSDSMADLEANFMHLQLMHESLSRFGENFASFLYGLNMNAFVVDFPEQPLAESIKQWQKQQRQRQREAAGLGAGDLSTMIVSSSGGTSTSNTAADTTYMTSDTSFASMKATPRRRTLGGVPPTPRTNSTVSSTVTRATGASATKRSGIPSTSRGGTTGRAGSRAGTRAGRASALPRGRGTSIGSGRGTG